MKKGRLHDEGYALVTVVLILTILITLGTALLSLASTDKKMAINAVKSAKALYLAEGGAQMALAKLVEDPAWREGISATPLGEGTITGVSLRDDHPNVIIQSTAQVGGVSRTVTVTVFPGLYQGFAVDYGQGNGSELNLHGSSKITGTMIFKQNIFIQSGSVVIEGDVIAGGNLTNHGEIFGNVKVGGDLYNYKKIDGNAQVGGKIINSGTITGTREKLDELNLPSLPPLDLSHYLDRPPDPFLSGDQTWDMEQLQDYVSRSTTGIIYVDGKVSINTENKPEPYRGTAMVVATKDIFINGNLVPETEEDGLGFIAGKSIFTNGSGKGEIVGIFRAGESFNSNSNDKIRGSMVAPTLNLASNVNLTFDKEVVEELLEYLPPEEKMRVIDWTEK